MTLDCAVCAACWISTSLTYKHSVENTNKPALFCAFHLKHTNSVLHGCGFTHGFQAPGLTVWGTVSDFSTLVDTAPTSVVSQYTVVHTVSKTDFHILLIPSL